MRTRKHKHEYLEAIELLLETHPEGLIQAEIARRIGVHRSTVNRLIPDLPGYIYIDDLDGGKWKLDRAKRPLNVQFNLHEATAIHLAARLLASVIDRQNPHAASTLRKLSITLERMAPHISRHLVEAAEMIDRNAQWQDANYLRVLEVLTLAWAEGRKVQVWHRKSHGEPVNCYTFSPYFIEPGAVGRSTYAIGLREPPGELRTFKIERIERAERTSEPYSIPPDFNPDDLLSGAWGIWFTNAEPVEVVLQFSPRAGRRVRETRWHPTQQITEQADGSLIWRAKVAEPIEMRPWIRGWGPDVIVLAPESLRRSIAAEAEQTLKHYYEVSNEPNFSAVGKNR